MFVCAYCALFHFHAHAVGVLVLGLGWWRRKRPSRSQRFVTEGSSPITHVHSLRDPTGRRLDNGPGDSFCPGDFKITVLSTVPACEQHLECCLVTPPKVIGLDCEWGGARGVPVALLQLAFPNKECALVHLSEVGCVVPKLAEILSDRRLVLLCVEESVLVDDVMVESSLQLGE